MARYKSAGGNSVDGKSFVRGLIYLFIGGVTMMFALVGIVFGATILFAAQAISDIQIMSDYKYPYACYSDNGTKLNQYGNELQCDLDKDKKTGDTYTALWIQDGSASENRPYANWESNNQAVAVGAVILVNALTLALALVGLIFFILGIKNTGIWGSTKEHM